MKIPGTRSLCVFALLAATRLDASYDVIMTLIVIAFVAVVVDVLVFLRALDRDA